jgi:hypothetical protein
MRKKLVCPLAAVFAAAVLASPVLASPVLAAHGGKAGSTIIAYRN